MKSRINVLALECSRGARLAVSMALMALVLTASAAAAGDRVTIPLPPIASIDDLAWTPMPGGQLMLTVDGETTMTILDGSGRASGKMYVPLPHIRDVHALRDGTIVLGDRRTGRIYHIKADGNLLGSAGSRGLSDGQFLQLDRVEADGKGRLYGLDGSELRVIQFSPKGERLGTFALESGPVVDADGRLLAVEDRASTQTRRIVAYAAPRSSKVLYEGKVAGGTRWEPMAALSDGAVVLRTFDLAGGCRVQILRADGKLGDEVSLADDAVLAGPARVMAVDPEEKSLIYLAGGPQGYRAIRVPLPR